MDCAACALNIQSVLNKQVGVQQAHVSFDTKTATVQYDRTKLSPEKILAAIDETGFKAERIVDCCEGSDQHGGRNDYGHVLILILNCWKLAIGLAFFAACCPGCN